MPPYTGTGNNPAMDTTDRENAERVSGLLCRYMWARRRCVGADAPPVGSDTQFTGQIQSGKREFGGIRVDPDAKPPILGDRNHPSFYRAIIERSDTVMPEMPDLAYWRNYVYFNGPMPKAPEPRPPFPPRTVYDQQRATDPDDEPPAAA